MKPPGIKREKWHDRPRSERLANAFYPGLADKETQAEMAAIAKGENKRAPQAQTLLPNATRGALSPLGGKAKR
jgi:hypothetical protein